MKISSKRRIPAINDKPAYLQLLAVRPSPQYRAAVTKSVSHALRRADAPSRASLILLAAVVPEFHGYEARQTLGSNLLMHEYPVVFMTAMPAEADRLQSFDLSGVDLPFQGLLTALQDANDAMLPRRYCQYPLTCDQVVSPIQHTSVNHFSLVVVDISLANHNQFDRVFKQYGDD